MKDRNSFFAGLIIIASWIMAVSWSILIESHSSSYILWFLIPYIIIFYSAFKLLYTKGPNVKDIKFGRQFKIVRKHQHFKDNSEYFYILQIEDEIHFVRGEMDLGESGKRYVMGKSNNSLVTFPVSGQYSVSE